MRKMNIVLIGMKKCGKSTLGRRLAQRMGCRFEDVDAKIESIYEQLHGKKLSFREIFRGRGEKFFSELEFRAMCLLADELSELAGCAVVSLGGRTAMNAGLRETIKSIGTVVYLRVAADELLERVMQDELPAFLDPADPEGSFRELYAKRQPVYESLADRIVDLDGLDESQSLETLVQFLQKS